MHIYAVMHSIDAKSTDRHIHRIAETQVMGSCKKKFGPPMALSCVGSLRTNLELLNATPAQLLDDH